VPRKRGRNQTLIASITLEGAVGEALSAFTPQDAAGWFAHCGYQPLDQPL
jgi:hypothetical protein